MYANKNGKEIRILTTEGTEIHGKR